MVEVEEEEEKEAAGDRGEENGTREIGSTVSCSAQLGSALSLAVSEVLQSISESSRAHSPSGGTRRVSLHRTEKSGRRFLSPAARAISDPIERRLEYLSTSSREETGERVDAQFADEIAR